jgi:isoquinoline 1-oxidoreductase beta subunit
MSAPLRSALSRREFLETTGAAGAGLLIGFHLPARAALAAAAAAAELNAWIHIGTDEGVTLIVSESEMGQGVLTSLPQVLADELDADWTRVRSEHALADRGRFGRQSTGGSTSIRTGYANLRKAGAAVREMLVRAAAETWGVDPAACRAERGFVVHDASRRRLSYGRLAERAATLPRPENPRLKEPNDFRYIGKSIPRLDTRDKVMGRATYGIDVQVPGMLVAQVVHCPVFGGKVGSFDPSAALAVPGVRHVVEIPTGVAVVADHFWAAKQGRDALRVTWDRGAHGDLSSAAITEMLKAAVATGIAARHDGDAAAALAGAARKVEAVYELPYLAHATMEPMNCTAHVRADACEVWAPTQSPSGTQDTAARITGLPPEKVTVHTMFMGGGFGRRSQTDFVADAVHASKAVGKPVKVVWTREDDTRGGYYRPPAYNTLAGGLDAAGKPVAWIHGIASPSIMAQFGPLRDGVDGAGVEGARNIPYHIPNVRVTYAKIDLPITLWFWRSVGSSLNAWVTECFVDELAAAAGQDPVAFRLSLLDEHPRFRRVLETTARESGWGSPLPAGRARGVALHESFGSIVAEVAEVSVGSDGTPQVHRVVCAVDCGDVVNPDIIKAQMESGIAYGLSAALWGELTIQGGAVKEGNFDSYPILRIGQMPRVDTFIVTSGDALGGIGEPGTPPIAPAVCNALFALTGRRIRRLPIGKVV